jgi:uncharacterized phage-associated protein
MRPSTVRESGIGPKLEAVLARLCEKLGSLYKTQAVKLPYLVDVIAVKELGRRITDARFEAWKQGVVARDAWVGVTYPQEGCAFQIERPDYDEGWTIRLAGRPETQLGEEEVKVVDFVAERYGSMNAQDLGTLTKALNPEIPRERWGSNAQPAVNEDAYARLSEGWQSFWRILSSQDLTDKSKWSEPIDDPDEYFRTVFRA